jgi:hypothetical protein
LSVTGLDTDKIVSDYPVRGTRERQPKRPEM